MQDLAGMMYDSIHKKLFPLADDVIVYPAHGPGSSCGKNLGPNTSSTIGEEKNSNYAMKATTKAAFIHDVTEGIAEPPQYFPINAMINKEGYDSLDAVLKQGLTTLSVDDFRKRMEEDDVTILDTRRAEEFTEGFIPGSVSIGLEGRFAEWAGSLLSFDAPILLVSDPGKEKETIIRLARVGFDKVQGYLAGGFEAWKKAGAPIDLIINVEADEMMMDMPFDNKLVVVDVRKPVEFGEGHLKGALNISLNDMSDPASMANLEEDQNIYVHCGGGYRSVIASSLLKRQGIHNLRNVVGGWSRIKQQEKVEIVNEKSILN
jgi:hydroxyacylglutathione hydrolase